MHLIESALYAYQAYLAEDIRRELGLHREELVALAYFLGCDYTEGVTGVGIVNALEIVQAFPMRLHADAADSVDTKSVLSGVSNTTTDKTSSNSSSSNSSSSSSSSTAALSDGRYPLEGLLKFKQWLEGFDFSETVLTKQAETSMKKLKGKRKRGGKGSRSKTKSKACDDGKSSSDSDHGNSSSSSSGSDLDDKDKGHSLGTSGTVSISVSTTRAKKGHSKTCAAKSLSGAVDGEHGPSGSKGEVLTEGDKHSSISTSTSGEKIPPNLATRLVSRSVSASHVTL